MQASSFQTETTGVAPPPRTALRRSLQIALCVVALLWYELADALAERAARGLTSRFDFEAGRPLLSALFLVFLLTVGFTVLEVFSRTGSTMRQALGLPRRETACREWTLGAAMGWGVAVAAVLPMALGRSLHIRFWTEPRSFVFLGFNLAALWVGSLAVEIGLRGYAFRRLVDAIGPSWATVLFALGLAVAQGVTPERTWISVLVAMVFAVLLALAWLRTHGLWLGWGLRFAWSASVALVFGLPLRGANDFASVVQTRAIHPRWLTGNGFGPEGALLTAFACVAAIAVLVLSTGDYAWDYTRREIVAAGYPVDPAPPAAHTAMEQEAAARPPALIQIVPVTSQSRSADKL